MKCPRCECVNIQADDVEVSYNNGLLPPDDFVVVTHCICNGCGQEWVE